MKKKGFTLIELLIVVAIIAILAAIAVPNFLEAQVRSKVSRVKADVRSIATAVESYYVDTNDYPASDTNIPDMNTNSGYGANDIVGASQSLRELPTFRRKANAGDLLQTLTTPISYITSYFKDPFAKSKGATYLYSKPSGSLAPEIQRSGWIIWSFGPDTDEIALPPSLHGGDIRLFNPGMFGCAVEESFYNPSMRVPSLAMIDLATYDPTNGSTSNGDVYRFKQ
jgi:prepilin-type N-terminal cleavage/methylation domain-containing protein